MPGKDFTELQGLYYLVWILVALFVVVAANIVRTRPGRAMQAIRDPDVAAEIVGISVARYKIGAFVISSAMASMAGAMLGVQQEFLTPGELVHLPVDPVRRGDHRRRDRHGVGGRARRVCSSPRWSSTGATTSRSCGRIRRATGSSTSTSSTRSCSEWLLILFLLFEPRGLAALWHRVKIRIGKRRTSAGPSVGSATES